MESFTAYLEDSANFCAHNYSPLKVVIKEGKGVWLTDINGKRYMDVHSAYSGVNFGHSHPVLLKAAQEQLEKVTLTSRAFLTDQLIHFCKELSEFCGMEMVLPMNSGAEAVETALKLARKWAYQKKGIPENEAEIICFANNFHGRTITIISFSDSLDARKDFGPYTPGFHVVPFGDIEAVKAKISSKTAAILFEPIQGEAGILFPPDGFLKELRSLATKNNILLLADEIQTGFCRTGKRFACDHEAIKPDIYILAKSLGGGIVPISAIVGKRELLSIFEPGTHGSTFSGNPFACAIARATLKLISENNFDSHALQLGALVMDKLRSASLKKVKEIRGRGLFIGVDIHKEFGKAKTFCEALMVEGILCKDTRDYSIRIAPPLVITEEEILWAIERIVKVLS